MATVDRIEMNYFGLTLYVTTRTGKEYACRYHTWTRGTGGSLDVVVQSWPGYGSYRGTVHLKKAQAQTFLKGLEMPRP